MKKIVRMLHIISLILLISVVISGCQAPRRPGNDIGLENGNNTDQERTQQESRVVEVNQEVIKSEAAADSLVDLRGIVDATVVFWGDKALVGVIISEGIIVEEMRNEIENIVKESNPTITSVDITTDRNIFVELDDVQQSLIRGEQINNISKDVESILNKINNTE
ncbi:hypothetical protein DW1_1626 [Proteiniborus sp. DW1]|uniref:YhcN/YlaJ family sporulation lipoprotein n=1 Tax=Proteiniborus sp. DW1 TaxID=1889883 RepID=UPI00092E07B7|nr:YhcN/YlaJ family sporulation lipoprotein [Proteiniborus sp. DW1]SCG83196.1 hypothetical protein DW1_1626 [Proteiniborus sp. DW1]